MVHISVVIEEHSRGDSVTHFFGLCQDPLLLFTCMSGLCH